jgi:5'-3' exonuclease
MRLNLIIDASSIFYRTLFTVGNFDTKKGERLLDGKKSQGVFMRKLATDLSSLVRNVEEPSRVIVCLDSSSWRKTIVIDEGGYKESRTKDETSINWKAFFELTENFTRILSQKGYIISKIPGAEADDLLYFWSKKLNDESENCILITGDRDLLQVLGKRENGSWTIALDPVLNRKKISLTQETLNYSQPENHEANIFDPNSWNSSSDVLDKIIKTHEINIVDPQKIRTMKVVLGDSGDSVPSVVTWRDKKAPEKIRTMTESNFGKILAVAPDLLDSTWEDLYEGKFVEEISSVMEGLKKIEVDREKVRENLKRNCQLVILSEKTIPHQITQIFNIEHATVPDSVAISSRDGILNGTEWWTSDASSFVPKSFDLFGGE